MTIRYQFNFENSGQGLFYNGKIDQFNIVYDCGSENKQFLNACINDYKKARHFNKIDLLILSHFHKDHVNGLDKLLENTKLDTVILPYMDSVEKLYLLNNVKFINSHNKQLLINPLDYFMQKGAQQIILIKKLN
ncbi:MBL fold metallo-hydrolase [Bacillus pacificus]